MSASPTAAEFHTPMQTPTTLGPAPSEAAKKKKKKKKKASNKVADKPEEQPSKQDAEADAFHDQLSQIDAYKHASNQPGSYYTLRGAQDDVLRLVQDDTRSEKAAEEASGGEKKVRAPSIHTTLQSPPLYCMDYHILFRSN